MLVSDYIKTFKNCFNDNEPMICLFYTYDEFEDFLDSLDVDDSKKATIWENVVKKFDENEFSECESMMNDRISKLVEDVSNEIR